ncbi:SHOCT domain-containing protein [Natronococcus sp. A-GB7]|uniref:SHOCT domain-containing protein n=1 Tax=Natronococcus sp. A-GB7 TaxID=3037649 RepID=UPI00241BE982|nr:SHOCT domain-containing protein [Natronococcus sp. A-GB7]MDG5821656.1 SHOCT domain-containing protein [Natronococcus sp. A-GB7]
MSGGGPTKRIQNSLDYFLMAGFVIIGFAGLYAGVTALALLGALGFFVITPLLLVLTGDRELIVKWFGEERAEQIIESETDTGEKGAPLEILKRKYAEGELSEAEFERKVAQLLEVDELELHSSESSGRLANYGESFNQSRATDAQSREREVERE